MNNFSDYTREEIEKAHYNVLSMLEKERKRVIKLESEKADLIEKHQNKLDAIKREKEKEQKRKDDAIKAIQEDPFKGFDDVSLSDVARYYKYTEMMVSEINTQKNFRNRFPKKYWIDIVTHLNLTLNSALVDGEEDIKLVLTQKEKQVLDSWVKRNKITEVK